MTRKRRPGDPKVAIAYIRVSKGKQALSPKVQRKMIGDYCQAQGIRIACWRFDADVHGDDDMEDRPRLMAALGDVAKKGAGLLIVARRDRLARELYVALTIERAVERAGGHVTSSDGTGNGSDPDSEMMRGIQALFGQKEVRLIRLRTKQALAAKKARGERVGNIAFGYRLAADGVHVEDEPAEQAVLARARALRASGLTIRAVAFALEAEGYKGRSGRALPYQQIGNLLK